MPRRTAPTIAPMMMYIRRRLFESSPVDGLGEGEGVGAGEGVGPGEGVGSEHLALTGEQVVPGLQLLSSTEQTSPRPPRPIRAHPLIVVMAFIY